MLDKEDATALLWSSANFFWSKNSHPSILWQFIVQAFDFSQQLWMGYIRTSAKMLELFSP